MKTLPIRLLATGVCLFAFTGCGKKDKKDDFDDTGLDDTPNVEAFYKANPDFFTFATPEDLPEGLTWETGMDEPELGSEDAKKGGTLNFYASDFPRTLRLVGPDASMGFRSFLLDNNGGPNGMGLTVRHPGTLKDIPCLASSWAIDPNKKTVYFKLDPEARYSDGKPVVASDYMYTFYFMRSKHLKAPWYNSHFATKYTNVTTYDDHTISLTFSEAKPDIVYKINTRPVPQHFYKAFKDDYLKRYNFRFEPTTGPYEVLPENLKKGQSVTLTKVKDWWAKDRKYYKNRYNPDKWHLQVIREPAKAFEVFLSGGIDFFPLLSLPEYWHDKLPDNHELVQNGNIEKVWFYNTAPRVTYGIRMNSSRAPLDNHDVRVGIQHALNWQKVIDKVFYGDYQRMNTVSDGYGAASHPTLKARGFDAKLAEEYFAKAGYTQRGPDAILRNSSGQRLSITLTSGYKPYESAFTQLKQEAKKAGLEINLEIIDYTAALKKVDEKKHQMSFSALNVSVELYPRFWEMYHSYHAYTKDGKPKPDTNNDTMTAEKDIDEMIDKYRASTSMAEITQLSHKLIERLHEDAAFAPAWKRPFYRVGKWRWLRYPEDKFDEKSARDPYEMSVMWIDEDIKKQVESGKTFPPTIKVYDQHKED